MLEINRQSNDRVHDIAACARKLQCTCRTSTVSPSTHRRHPGEDIHEVPLGVTHCGGSHARTLFNSVLVYALQRCGSIPWACACACCMHCTVYRDLAMSRSFVVFFFFFFFWVSWIRIFWMRFRIVVFPSDFRNKYDFFVTVGSSDNAPGGPVGIKPPTLAWMHPSRYWVDGWDTITQQVSMIPHWKFGHGKSLVTLQHLYAPGRPASNPLS